MNGLSIIASYFDRILLFHFYGAIPLSIYAFATAMPDQIKSSLKTVSQLALPKFSEKNMENIQESIFSHIGKFIIVTLPITILYIIAAPFLFKIFFPQYFEAVWYSQIYALVIILTPKTLFRSALEAQKKNRSLYNFQILGFIFRFASVIFFIKYGIMGLVIAELVSETLVFIQLGSLFLFSKKIT
jgi:hypothetical protein